MQRREMLKITGVGMAAAAPMAAARGLGAHGSSEPTAQSAEATPAGWFGVRSYGAKGDGTTTDTPAINRAIEAAATAGGGTVHFPAGAYLSYSIHLKSK